MCQLAWNSRTRVQVARLRQVTSPSRATRKWSLHLPDVQQGEASWIRPLLMLRTKMACQQSVCRLRRAVHSVVTASSAFYGVMYLATEQKSVAAKQSLQCGESLLRIGRSDCRRVRVTVTSARRLSNRCERNRPQEGSLRTRAYTPPWWRPQPRF